MNFQFVIFVILLALFGFFIFSTGTTSLSIHAGQIAGHQMKVGEDSAKIKIIHYFDYYNAASRRIYRQLTQIRATDPDVQIIFRPLASSEQSETLIRATIAAKDYNLYEGLYNHFMRIDESAFNKTPEMLLAEINQTQLLDHINDRSVDLNLYWNKFLAWAGGINSAPALIVEDEIIKHDAYTLQQLILLIDKKKKVQ